MSTFDVDGKAQSTSAALVHRSVMILFVLLVAMAMFGVWQYFHGAVEQAVSPVGRPHEVAPQ